MITQVNASAGSGKTHRLTAHFLKLLENAAPLPEASGCALHGNLAGYSLAEILAATFTNKAAAEMQSRVLARLKQTALEERVRTVGATGGQAEIWLDRILRHFSRLNIRTIDSLLTTLVRLSVLELRLPPDFEPSFAPEEYFTPLYESLMEDLAGDDLVSPLSSDLSATGANADRSEPAALALSSALPLRSGPGRNEPRFLSDDAATLRARLVDACQDLLYLRDMTGFTLKNRLHDLLLELVDHLLRGRTMPRMDIAAIRGLLHDLHNKAQNACRNLNECIVKENLNADKRYLAYLARCASSSAYKKLPDSPYHAKPRLDDCLNKASKGAASVQAETAFAEARAAREDFDAHMPLLLDALQLAPLTVLAREIHARIMADQSGSGRLPALRLPALAGAVLSGESGVSDALCRLGSRLSRLLLDEFQDTSREQWTAILPLAVESLATGGELTYVGDVKQAIYGWRGGDARLFDEALREPDLTAVSPRVRTEQLPCNWRSHPRIVRHNNTFFSLLGNADTAVAVMAAMLPRGTPESYVRRGGAEASRSFSRVVQEIPPEKHWERDPRSPDAAVRLYFVEGKSVSHIQDLVRQRLRILFLEELRLVWNYGDITVLVQTADEAALVAQWLTEWGLPVVTENSFLLVAHPLIGRLISFLAFLDYPLGDLALYEFVSGWECLGLYPDYDPAILTDWLALESRRHNKKRPPLYQLFRQRFPELWERAIAPFYAKAGLMSAYDTLIETVKHFDLARRMPEHLPFVRRLLELAHLAETRGHSSLAAFLAFWENCRDSEKLPLPEHMDAVRIMTIHKAKGLEFPVVVLPFQHKGRRRDPELIDVSCRDLRVLTRAAPLLEDVYYQACITDELERLNLLYVAWTRPVYALHAFITRPRVRTPLTEALQTLLDIYRQKHGEALCQWEDEPKLAGEGEKDAQAGTGEATSESGPESLSRPAVAIPEAPACLSPVPKELPPSPVPEAETWHPMSWLPRLKIYRSTLPETVFTPRQRGILTHLCLEHLHISAGATRASLDEDVARAVRLALRLFPLPLEDPENVAGQIRDNLCWFLSQKNVPAWLEHGLREQGIMDARGHMHRVDLLVDLEACARADSGERSPSSYGPNAYEPDASAPAGQVPLLAVDYKTGRSDEQVSDETHQQQVRRYMRLLAEATGRPVRGLLVYLDKRRLEPVETA